MFVGARVRARAPVSAGVRVPTLLVDDSAGEELGDVGPQLRGVAGRCSVCLSLCLLSFTLSLCLYLSLSVTRFLKETEKETEKLSVCLSVSVCHY